MWSSVQVERPSCSTSGGHSGDVLLPEEVEVDASAAPAAALLPADEALLVIARQDAADVQVRHLFQVSPWRTL